MSHKSRGFTLLELLVVLVIIGIIVMYTLLAELQPPVVRAAVFGVLLCIAAWTGRRGSAFNSLSSAGLGGLAINPADVLHKFPHQLSGGQLQRMLIARALMLDIRLLVADEIISMLDASTRIDVLNLLGDLKSRGLGILFITHDLDEALALADRVLLFSNRPGRIVGSWDVSPTTLDVTSRASLRAELLDRYRLLLLDQRLGLDPGCGSQQLHRTGWKAS